MIFAEKYKARRFEEGRKEGREEGRQRERRAWEEWNTRRLQALANGEPFDEPPPSAVTETQT
jgi:flagellar biosynthesis/type III secretory pathway protein FliH